MNLTPTMHDNLDSSKRVFNLMAEASSIMRKSELHNWGLMLHTGIEFNEKNANNNFV